MTGLELARLFHETYERLAPDFGYETREDTREFDSESKNGRLMVATCSELLKIIDQHDNEIVGPIFRVVSPIFEGLAKVVGVNNDGMVYVCSTWSGAIYIVEEKHLMGTPLCTECVKADERKRARVKQEVNARNMELGNYIRSLSPFMWHIR